MSETKVPEGILCSNTHEWVLESGNLCTIGLTDYAIEQLGDVVFVEKLGLEEGATYTFEKVLAVCGPDGFVAGNPTVSATVTASVVKNGKGKKIHIIRYKPKKDSKKHIGHRQPYTKLQILSIAL